MKSFSEKLIEATADFLSRDTTTRILKENKDPHRMFNSDRGEEADVARKVRRSASKNKHGWDDGVSHFIGKHGVHHVYHLHSYEDHNGHEVHSIAVHNRDTDKTKHFSYKDTAEDPGKIKVKDVHDVVKKHIDHPDSSHIAKFIHKSITTGFD